MIILLDTNVVLDVLLDRREFSASASQVFALAELKSIGFPNPPCPALFPEQSLQSARPQAQGD